MAIIKSNGYTIVLGANAFKALNTFLSKNKYSAYFILCDENTIQHCLPLLITSCTKLAAAEIIELESGEASKSLEIAAHIWQTFIENKADKKTLLINLGGGVVSDLGGFTASVYKRGIDFINIPTSLLAMADASVGGKTGIDFSGLKNVIGTFSQPKAVFIYTGFLKTLNERHFKNGLAEIYKLALACDKQLWLAINKEEAIETLVLKSVVTKNKIVLKDPYDKGIRNALNFGHTLGHAIESFYLGSKKEVLHGEAVTIGILLESYIALQKKLLSKAAFLIIVSKLKSYFSLQSIHDIPLNEIIQRIGNDKKNSQNKFRFALITKIGTSKINVEVTETQIKNALDYYNRLLKNDRAY